MEKTITNAIIRRLNKDPRIWVRKRYNSGMTGTKGWPDITGIVCLQVQNRQIGVRIEIEVKQFGKKPTVIQYNRLRKFRKLGCIAFWTDDLEKCMISFQHWCNNIGIMNHDQADLLPRGKIFIAKEL